MIGQDGVPDGDVALSISLVELLRTLIEEYDIPATPSSNPRSAKIRYALSSVSDIC